MKEFEVYIDFESKVYYVEAENEEEACGLALEEYYDDIENGFISYAVAGTEARAIED